MLLAKEVKLYPTKEQATMFNKLLGNCRVVYNQCLSRKKTSYEERKFSENLKTLTYFLHHELMEDENFFYLKEQNTKVYHQVLQNLLKAYKNFYENRAGYPRFKSKSDSKQSCCFPKDAISKKNVYSSRKLSLANIKNIKFKCSPETLEYIQNNKDRIKNATLAKLPTGEYYLSILFDSEIIKTVKKTDACIGIDLGIKNAVITSEAEVYENKHFAKKEEKRIKRRQRTLSRKQKGSNNRNKARKKLAKAYKKVTDRKKNYLHYITNMLIDENQVICMEDLNVKGMTKNHKLAGAIQEVNLGEFRRMLEYKAAWYGRKVVFVGRFYPSSKTCHECGHVNEDLKLSDRTWVCPHCGAVIDRDYNAALNILDEGLRILDSQ